MRAPVAGLPVEIVTLARGYFAGQSGARRSLRRGLELDIWLRKERGAVRAPLRFFWTASRDTLICFFYRSYYPNGKSANGSSKSTATTP